MVAALYDASLDAYLPHQLDNRIRRVPARTKPYGGAVRERRPWSLNHLVSTGRVEYRSGATSYRAFPAEITANLWGYRVLRQGQGHVEEPPPLRGNGVRRGGRAAAMEDRRWPHSGGLACRSTGCKGIRDGCCCSRRRPRRRTGDLAQEQRPGPTSARSPPARTSTKPRSSSRTWSRDANGVVQMEFTMPEALTKWGSWASPTTRALRSGFLDGHAVTAKDLMVQPNPPRFLREGDVIEFTVKVSNQSATRQTGTVRLTLADARTLAGP